MGLCCTGPALAWDGRGTQAPSGTYPLPEPTTKRQNLDTDSGTETKPQSWYNKLPERDYVNLDPQELDDYAHRDYSPYALARFTQDLRWQGRTYPQGYYHVKIGLWGAGSLGTLPLTNQLHAGSLPQPDKDKKRPMDVFVLKQHGNVLTVIPIAGHQAYQKPKHGHRPANSLAWIEWQGDQPVLKFYYRKTIYFAYLEP